MTRVKPNDIIYDYFLWMPECLRAPRESTRTEALKKILVNDEH